MLEVLEFYTDQQRRGNGAGDDFGAILPNNMRPSGSSSLASGVTSMPSASVTAGRYTPDTSLAPGGTARFAGTGLGGISSSKSNPALNVVARVQRQDSYEGARENGRSATPQPAVSSPGSTLQATRPAPARPLIATRPAPAAPNVTPSSADLRARAKAHGPGGTAVIRPGTSDGRELPTRSDSLQAPPSVSVSEPPSREPVRPVVQSAKSIPATQPPPSVKPLATSKKPSRSPSPNPQLRDQEREREQREREREREREQERERDRERARERERERDLERERERELEKARRERERELAKEKEREHEKARKDEESKSSVAAAAAALEKPKPTQAERRISSLTEAQIMEKLRSVVSAEDPKTLYSTIKKIGQGYVAIT